VSQRSGSAQQTSANKEAALPPTMAAVVQEAYGGPEVFRLTQRSVPTIAEHEVLVRVRAAGLDHGTWHLMTGKPPLLRLAFGLRTPRNPVPGLDLAGVVEAVGSAVSRFAVGDEVYGIGRGSFAEYAAALEDKLSVKPANLSFEQAAAVPVSGLTALQGLCDVTPLKPGQRVLITGASGGVGSYAVQIAKASGAHVTAECSAAKGDFARSLGADHVLDYRQDDFADGRAHFDLIFDLAGNPTLRRLRRALTPSGTAVIAGGEHGVAFVGGLDRQLRALCWSPLLSQRLTGLISKERGSDLARLTTLIESGRLAPSLDRTFPLAAVREAMRYFAEGRVLGKVALAV
jgi:NADPH:quinone reductase-like Zn-dependent oxidoreductase